MSGRVFLALSAVLGGCVAHMALNSARMSSQMVRECCRLCLWIPSLVFVGLLTEARGRLA